MIRTYDPLFPAFLTRLGGKTAAKHLIDRSNLPAESATKSLADSQPRWDAPAHWIEPETHW